MVNYLSPFHNIAMQIITKLILLSSLIGGFSLSINNKENAPICVNAISALSYDDDATMEPNYNEQNDLTFEYMNLGSTLNNYRGDKIKVGVIDSGIYYDHEDFNNGSINANSRYYKYSTTDSKWYYYSYDKYKTELKDTFHHGTEVASTIASAINSLGGVGIAPNVELYIFKVSNSANGYEIGAIQCALKDAADLKLDVVNMSIQSYEHAVTYGSSYQGASTGCSTQFSYYINEAYEAGVMLVSASGNFNTDEPSYPASNDHVISVGSLEKYSYDTKASYSNYGQYVDLVAPGYVNVATNTDKNAYKTISGTSFSAPLVTGAIALYKQKNPTATPSQIEEALYASCDKIDDSSSPYTNWAGHGALNVEKFLGIDESTFTGISPDATSLSMYKNTTHQISLKASHEDGNLTNQIIDPLKYTFISSNPNVATVSSTGKIASISGGKAVITVQGPNNKSCSIDINVNPVDVPLTSVELSEHELNVFIDDKPLTLNCSFAPSYATNRNVAFTSSNNNVVEVDENGKLKYKAYGESTITVTSEESGFTDQCLITVYDIVTDYDGRLISLYDESSFALNARFEPNNDNSFFVYDSNSEMNTIDDNGVISLSVSGVTIIGILGCVDGLNNGETSCVKYIYLYIDDGDTSEKAQEWANEFLKNISCDSSGNTPPSVEGWNKSKTSFSSLEEVHQHYIATYLADENSSDVISKAMYKYDYVISKYNKSSVVYAEFINGRNKPSSIFAPTLYTFTNTKTILISSIAVIALACSIGVFIFIKVKHEKENN